MTEQPIRRTPVFITIVALVILTVIGAFAVWKLRSGTDVDQIVSELKGRPTSTVTEDATVKLAAAAQDKNAEELRKMAEQTVQSFPANLEGIAEKLIKEHRDRYSRRLAVYIAEMGADKYHYNRLIRRAGYEYMEGRFVTKDFQKAEHFLSDIALQLDLTSQYYLGLVLVDPQNPNRNEDRGVDRLRFAADGGYKPAQDKLAEIGK